MKRLLFIFLILGIGEISFSQEIKNTPIYSKEKRGAIDMENYHYVSALKKYQKLYEKSYSDDIKKEYALKIAECYQKMSKPSKALEVYNKLEEEGVIIEGVYAESYADAYQMTGDYKNALKWYNTALSTSEDRQEIYDKLKNLERVKQKPSNIFYGISSVPFNSEADDFCPYPYNEGFLFISNRKGTKGMKKSAWDGKRFYDIFYVDKEGDVKNFSSKINTAQHEATASISKDGNLLAFTKTSRATKDETGTNTIQIYLSEKNEKGEWGKPYEFQYNSDKYSTGHPAFSRADDKLYFVSNKPGGFGGTDIYFTQRSGEGWSEPKLLGKEVNSPENEMFPYISENNRLYFSSNGWGGYGGLDLFMQEIGNYTSTPFNLKYPLNSSYDDFGGMKTPDGKIYISSNRRTEMDSSQNDNIYEVVPKKFKAVVIDKVTRKPIIGAKIFVDEKELLVSDSTGFFEIDQENWSVKQNLISKKEGYTIDTLTNKDAEDFIERNEVAVMEIEKPYVEGYVKDSLTQKPVIVRITVSEKNTDHKFTIYPDSTGYYRFQTNGLTNYDLIAERPKYFTMRRAVDTKNNPLTKRNITMIPVKGNKVRIYYDYNRAFIRKDATHALDTVITVMNLNPTIKIELSAHTDSRGSASYNMTLSERRAKKAYDYAVEHGIDADRMTYKGYGKTDTVVDCSLKECTEEEHQLNRRTEFYVTGFINEENYFGSDMELLEDQHQTGLLVNSNGEIIRNSNKIITGTINTITNSLSGYKVTVFDDKGKVLNESTTTSEGVFNLQVTETYKYLIKVSKDEMVLEEKEVTADEFDLYNTFDIKIYI